MFLAQTAVYIIVISAERVNGELRVEHFVIIVHDELQLIGMDVIRSGSRRCRRSYCRLATRSVRM